MAKTAEVVGGKSSKKRKREKSVIEPVSESAADAGNSKFARALASPDWTTREKGLQILTLWLKRRPDITDSDLNKIWKGLFYAFWHADKAPVQEALAERLAQILPQLGDQVALAYFRIFFATLRREWFGIDRLRLDKFMMLVRKFVQQTFVLMRDADWAEEVVDAYVDVLTEEVLLKEDGPPALGLVYHLADCYVPEMLAADGDGPIPAAAVPLLLSPFTRLLAEMRQPAGINRAMGSAFGPLLAACRPGEQAAPSFAQPQLLTSLAQTVFELGAQAEVRTRNREALYQLSKQLHKAARKLSAADGGPAAGGVAASPAAQAQPSAAAAAAVSPAATPAASPVAAAAAAAADAIDAAAATPSSAATRKAAKRALSRLARASTAADALASPAAGQAGGEQPAAAATPPQADAHQAPAAASAKKGKKKKRRASGSDGVDVPAMNNSAAGAVGTAEPAGRVHSTRGRAGADIAAQPDNSATPVGATAVGTRAAAACALAVDSASERKSVHFRLKHNLHFEHGGPVPSPEIRTPPSARPKGPALRAQPATDPGKLNTSTRKRHKTHLMSPSSIPRTKAAAFF